MGSFPETYNDPNRLRSKRRPYSTKASKTFRSSYCAKVEERVQPWKEEWRGRWREKEETLPRKPHDSIKRAMIFLCFLFSSFVSFTQYSSLDRKRSLPRQRVFTYPPLKFVVETFLFPRPRVFSSRPIKSLIVTPLLAIELAGIRIGRILREKEDSHPLLGSVKLCRSCS